MIEYMAFDLDGVVIPSGPGFEYFRSKFDVGSINYLDFFMGPFQDCLIGKTDLFEVLPEALRSWGWKGTVEQFASEWMKTGAHPEPEMVEIIKTLISSGVRCCAASNQDNRRAAFLDNLPWLQELFEKRFYSCNMGVAKPGSGYFRTIESECRLEPQRILFVDDKVENIEAARACGWHAELCKGATDLRTILAVHCPGLLTHCG